MNRVLFLIDTKSLGKQTEREFLVYIPNDDHRPFSDIYGVYRLKSSRMPQNTQIYINAIQRMCSIMRGEELDESAEETPFMRFPPPPRWQKPKSIMPTLCSKAYKYSISVIHAEIAVLSQNYFQFPLYPYLSYIIRRSNNYTLEVDREI